MRTNLSATTPRRWRRRVMMMAMATAAGRCFDGGWGRIPMRRRGGSWRCQRAPSAELVHWRGKVQVNSCRWSCSYSGCCATPRDDHRTTTASDADARRLRHQLLLLTAAGKNAWRLLVLITCSRMLVVVVVVGSALLIGRRRSGGRILVALCEEPPKMVV